MSYKTRRSSGQTNLFAFKPTSAVLILPSLLRCLLDETLLRLDTLCPLTVAIVSH